MGTAGHSRTVENFLKHAGKKRSIKVIVAEGAPHFQGHKMAANLSEAKIDVDLITDSAVFAIMSRVNKVILGTHSILADGGLQNIAGSHMIAVSAAHHSVPLLVVSAMYKLSPQFFRSADHDTFNQFLSPEKNLPSGQRWGVNHAIPADSLPTLRLCASRFGDFIRVQHRWSRAIVRLSVTQRSLSSR